MISRMKIILPVPKSHLPVPKLYYLCLPVLTCVESYLYLPVLTCGESYLCLPVPVNMKEGTRKERKNEELSKEGRFLVLVPKSCLPVLSRI